MSEGSPQLVTTESTICRLSIGENRNAEWVRNKEKESRENEGKWKKRLITKFTSTYFGPRVAL